MKNRRPPRLGDLQLKIMKLLWENGPSTVAEIHRTLTAEKPFAYTTIATMLRKMEARELVTHQIEGRSFIYQAAVQEQTISRGMAGDLLDRLFEGSLSDMVSHLLTHREISPEELGRLEKIIAEKKAKK